MIITIPSAEKESMIKACETASLQCEVFDYKDSQLITVMVTSEGDDISSVMAYRLGGLVAANEEVKHWMNR